MASSQITKGMQLRLDFETIRDEIACLADQEQTQMDIRDGKVMSEQDVKRMRIFYNDSASKAFWKPNVKDANLDDELEGHEELIAEIEDSGYSLRTPTVIQGYPLSVRYCDFLYFCICRAALYNPVFHGPEGPSTFEEIHAGYAWTSLPLESRLMFGTPGHPHITILSLQPQQIAKKELMYTEFWTLYYWAVTLGGRVKYNSNKDLPVRLVSVCGKRARVVSAVFSSGYMRCVGSRTKDPKGEDVSCKIHIGDDYDLIEPASCLSFATEMIAQPIGNQTTSKEQAAIERKGRLFKG